MLSEAHLVQLQRYCTPAVYNGWELISSHDSTRDCFNLEPLTDYMPALPPLVGYAVTVVLQPSDVENHRTHPEAMDQYNQYIASAPGPKIVVVQDLDKPAAVGAFWGEVNSTLHRALGCVGTITDGAIRDLDEMRPVGFKALARCLCIGHACAWPVRWNCPVEVFGTTVQPGQLIHADQHGFLAVPPEDEPNLFEAVRFIEDTEAQTIIPAARFTANLTTEQILERFTKVRGNFYKTAKDWKPSGK